MLTAGIGAFLWMQRGHHTKSELSRFLITRGIWLAVLEITILRFIYFFQISYHDSIVILLILWAIGLSMIVLAALVHLPTRVLLPLSIVLIVTHNLFDPVQATRFGHSAFLWNILHQQGLFTFFGVNFVIAYPILPWFAVMACGYCMGNAFLWDPARRQRFFLRLGIALTLAFILIRAINIYGDPVPWTHQSTALFTVLSFLNTTKYPPSLHFLLMTLGPAIASLSWFDRQRFSEANPLIVFGRVPFLFYVAHFLLAHLSEVLLAFLRYGRTSWLFLPPPSMGSPAEIFPPNFGYPLWVVYAVWIAILVILYPVCLWFSRLKKRRRDWWLSYL